jgi:hypothetical protein
MRAAIVTHPVSWRGLLPLTPEQRVVQFCDRLIHRAGYDHAEHAHRVRRGVTWIDEFKHRPIPKHRALVTIQQLEGATNEYASTD